MPVAAQGELVTLYWFKCNCRQAVIILFHSAALVHLSCLCPTTDLSLFARLLHSYKEMRGWVGMRGAGHSKGGDTVVTYAAKYDDIPRVVNVSGRFHLDKGQTHDLRSSPPSKPPRPLQQVTYYFQFVGAKQPMVHLPESDD